MAEKLRIVSKDELTEILKNHRLWLESGDPEKKRARKGKRADLSKVDLSGIDLSGVDLSEANLSEVHLIGARLMGINLSRANLSRADLTGAKLRYANLVLTNFTYADLFFVDLRDANLSNANLKGVNLKRALYNPNQLKQTINTPIEYLSEKDIILDTESQIQFLKEEKKELQEKLQQASNTNQEEKERLKQVEEQLEQAEQTIQREQEAKKKTTEQIEAAVKYLKNPNTYIAKQITIQYILMGLYIGLSIMTVWFFVHYIDDNYTNFKLNMNAETTFINWLFYASPLLISFSLIIVFINQINARLQNIVRLNERKRYVDSVEGGLQAINALSINNEDARKKILDTMEKIIDHTLQSSEKANEPITLEEKVVEDPLSTLSKIKDLVK